MKKVLLSEFTRTYPPVETAVIEEVNPETGEIEEKEVEVVPDGSESHLEKEDYRIKTLIPNCITVNHETRVATLTWFCEAISGRMFTINNNYNIESDEDLEFIETIPFYAANMYSTNIISLNMFMTKNTNYITDLEFDGIIEDSDYITLDGFVSDVNGDTCVDIKLEIPLNAFISMKFIDNYICEGIVNNAELHRAAVDVNYTETPKIVYIDDVSSDIVVAPASKYTVAVKYNGISSSNTDEAGNKIKEIYSLITFFGCANKVSKYKYKGMTVEKLTDGFLAQPDEYISMLMFNLSFKELNNSYVAIYARNKDNVYKLFVIDKVAKNKLDILVSNYAK